MDAISQSRALGDLDGAESARFFVAGRFDALECMTATFTTHAYVPHRHETYAIGAIEAGCETWTARGIRHYAGPGEFAFNDPEVVHDGAPLAEGYSYRMIYPSTATLRRLAADLAGGRDRGTPGFPQAAVRDPEGAALYAEAHRRLQAGTDPFGAEELMTRALARCLARHADIPVAALGREPGPVARVRARLEADPTMEHSLADLAAIAGLTPHRLIRAFRRETGLTPHAYLVDRRVAAARDRLRGGERPAEVAAATGFADQAHLTRAFKARMGVTPGAYRTAFLA
ncbi:AraC family transcriptional regulator [Prosthecomicrobium hirschii]|uniref:AraC family transcriptional regulator n=1 Tax=Prosthecodimorpha hirschii TaxID=665126 RepID=UPI00221EC11B|nr:AraC family transcriptional regulator [Prosthecomicrobium hirschii]MCW1843829.1 AraC family transcriptional regulator [Prosthecomicrobium hirschii]